MADQTKAPTKGQDAGKAQEKRRRPEPAPEHTSALAAESMPFVGLLGDSAMDLPVENHAALLGDPRFSHPANAVQRAQIAVQLQETYGNAHVHRVVSLARGLTPNATTMKTARGQTSTSSAVSGELTPHSTRDISSVSAQSTTAVQKAKAPNKTPQWVLDTGLAVIKHVNDRETLKKHIEDGFKSTTDARLKYSCEWIKTGRAKLFALTPTGDSAQRVTEAGEDPTKKRAYYPKGMSRNGPADIYSAAVSYNMNDLQDNTNVEIDDNNTAGWNLPGVIAITNPQKAGKAYVWETLKHEVQHDADKHGSSDLEGYKTEYRAYSYEGGAFDAFSMTKKVNHRGYQWTEKQWEIFKHVEADYAHTKRGWANNPNVGGKSFREAVVAHKDPGTEAVNPLNSIRVDDLRNAIDSIDVSKGKIEVLFAVVWQEVYALIEKLNKDEARAVLNSPPMLRKLSGKFKGWALRELTKALTERSK